MNKRNYQKELDGIIQAHRAAGERPRLLVHSCCAPCSSYVMEYLAQYFELTMFFYNPNMDSREEYDRRAAELVRLVREMNTARDPGGTDREEPAARDGQIRVVAAEYTPEDFERIAKGHERDPERGARCRLCYELRLRKTAEYMKEHGGYDYFTTTLTLSPLKDAEALNDIAERIAKEYGLRCLPSDFKKREGYKRSIELSREYGLYRQDYCGCRFSRRQETQKTLKQGDIVL